MLKVHTVNYISEIDPSLLLNRAIIEFRILEAAVPETTLTHYVKLLSNLMGTKLHPGQNEPIIFSVAGSSNKNDEMAGILFFAGGHINFHYWTQPQIVSVQIQSSTSFNCGILEEVTRKFFAVCEYFHHDLITKTIKADSSKIEVRSNAFGKGVYAAADIQRDEIIAGFYGEIYENENGMAIPEVAVNHAIQFNEFKWRDSHGIARYLNHSCNPNCGIMGLFDVVAIRDIRAGEQLLWDYAMTDDSYWENPEGKCLCGSANCRGSITQYHDLPQAIKDRYRNYTSHWLLQTKSKL